MSATGFPARIALAVLVAAMAALWGEAVGFAQDPPHHTRHLPPAPPPPVKVSVAAEDTPLVLYTTLAGSGPSSASGSVRMMLSGSPTLVLRLVAADLVAAEDKALRIDRSDISIPAGTTLTADIPLNLQVTVSNIARPGTYAGKLMFLGIGQADPIHILPVTVHAHARPDVVPVQTAVSQRVATCSDKFGCWLAGLILPESMVTNDIQIQLENKARESAVITGSTLLLRGEHSGAMVAQAVLLPDPALPRSLLANQLVTVVLALKRNLLPPDHYQGALRLSVQGRDEPISINLDLSVRQGPLLPMLILLVGIFVGRLVQKMDTPEIQRQLRLLDRYTALTERAAAVTNPVGAQLVQRYLSGIRAQIEAGRDSEETIQLTIDKLLAIIDLLVNIEELEQLATAAPDAIRSEALRSGAAARQLLAADKADKFAEAEDKRRHMEVLLAEGQGSQGGLTVPEFDGAQRLVLLQSAALAVADSGWRRAKAALRFLSGLTSTNANLRYWLLRPMLSVALLILLSLLGLQQLYVSAGTTFGASGLYDYLGLLIWGLSADIAQRGLHSLPGVSAR